MKKKLFTRQELRDSLNVPKDNHTRLVDTVMETKHDSKIMKRLIELYGHRHIYGKCIKFSVFMEHEIKLQIKGDFPEGGFKDGELLPFDPGAHIVVFKSEGGVWSAVAVFESHLPDHPKTELRNAMFGWLDQVGIEYVPIPAALIELNYLQSPDFKRRSKRAIFAPTEIPFRKFPAAPAGGWTTKEKA